MADVTAIALPLLIILYFASWVIAMCGLAAAQNLAITSSWSLALEWFILFFQFFIALLVPVACMSSLGKKIRTSLIGLLAIVSTVWLFTANNAYHRVRSNSTVNNATGGMFDSWISTNDARWNTVVAGASLLFICNVFAMFLLDVSANNDDNATVVTAAPTKGNATPVTVVQVPESKGSPDAVAV